MTPMMLRDFGTADQRWRWMEPLLQGEMGWCFGLTEAAHGSDATWMETRALPRDGVEGWSITGEKMWTPAYKASHVWCSRGILAKMAVPRASAVS